MPGKGTRFKSRAQRDADEVRRRERERSYRRVQRDTGKTHDSAAPVSQEVLSQRQIDTTELAWRMRQCPELAALGEA